MSKTHTHAPGPWETHQDGIRAVDSREMIATVFAVDGDTGRRDGCGPSDANASLIAAAPDLLAAAKDVIYDLELLVSRQGPGPDRRLAALKAAIARADGPKPA